MSRTVSRRAQAARRVHQSAEAHADTIGARLDAEFAAAGIAGPPAGDMIRALGDLIMVRVEAMEVADRAHDEELADDAGPRHDRDVAVEALAAAFPTLRNIMAVVGDAALVKRLGLAGRTPRTPDELVQAAKIVHARLTEVPIPRQEGLAVDPVALAALLAGKIGAVTRALFAVDREVREAEATLQAKHQAIAAYDQTFSGAAAALSALFVLADETDLARRVRPSQRKPGQTADQDDAGEDGEADAGPSVDAPEADAPSDGPILRPLRPGGGES